MIGLLFRRKPTKLQLVCARHAAAQAAYTAARARGDTRAMHGAQEVLKVTMPAVLRGRA